MYSWIVSETSRDIVGAPPPHCGYLRWTSDSRRIQKSIRVIPESSGDLRVIDRIFTFKKKYSSTIFPLCFFASVYHIPGYFPILTSSLVAYTSLAALRCHMLIILELFKSNITRYLSPSFFLVLDQNVSLSVRFVRNNLKLTVLMSSPLKMSRPPNYHRSLKLRVLNYGRREEWRILPSSHLRCADFWSSILHLVNRAFRRIWGTTGTRLSSCGGRVTLN